MTEWSHKKKEDLRVERTFRRLSQALKSLLLERPFEDIFVTDICERAIVHRTTFYKHFKDKYHLLEFCVRQLIQSFEGPDEQIVSTESMKEYYINLIRKSLLYMADHRALLKTGILRSGNNSALPMFHRSIAGLIETKLIENEKLGYDHLIPCSMIAQYYSGALISASIWWLENDVPISIDEMVHDISLLINESGYLVKK
ncbi:MAG: TetR/AcrR family transcriptional regulator C-terminal domain-containing protein [Eubacteriales bacterium]|nr:TetR/AcrR family transcriptional regulator C-terminal domain-containing protein [Eubacteriales bacterium]